MCYKISIAIITLFLTGSKDLFGQYQRVNPDNGIEGQVFNQLSAVGLPFYPKLEPVGSKCIIYFFPYKKYKYKDDTYNHWDWEFAIGEKKTLPDYIQLHGSSAKGSDCGHTLFAKYCSTSGTCVISTPNASIPNFQSYFENLRSFQVYNGLDEFFKDEGCSSIRRGCEQVRNHYQAIIPSVDRLKSLDADQLKSEIRKILVHIAEYKPFLLKRHEEVFNSVLIPLWKSERQKATINEGFSQLKAEMEPKVKKLDGDISNYTGEVSTIKTARSIFHSLKNDYANYVRKLKKANDFIRSRESEFASLYNEHISRVNEAKSGDSVSYISSIDIAISELTSTPKQIGYVVDINRYLTPDLYALQKLEDTYDDFIKTYKDEPGITDIIEDRLEFGKISARAKSIRARFHGFDSNYEGKVALAVDSLKKTRQIVVKKYINDAVAEQLADAKELLAVATFTKMVTAKVKILNASNPESGFYKLKYIGPEISMRRKFLREADLCTGPSYEFMIPGCKFLNAKIDATNNFLDNQLSDTIRSQSELAAILGDKEIKDLSVEVGKLLDNNDISGAAKKYDEMIALGEKKLGGSQ